jgi:hypothetical protein
VEEKMYVTETTAIGGKGAAIFVESRITKRKTANMVNQ